MLAPDLSGPHSRDPAGHPCHLNILPRIWCLYDMGRTGGHPQDEALVPQAGAQAHEASAAEPLPGATALPCQRHCSPCLAGRPGAWDAAHLREHGQ